MSRAVSCKSRACVEDVDHDLINHQLRATRDLQLKCEFIRLFEAYTRGYQNFESSIMILFVFSELPLGDRRIKDHVFEWKLSVNLPIYVLFP